eukprot:XP_011676598.1 PREDICTED: ubiquitin carboxyl-terminal hydrolase 37 isoform X1 [Strongylocentrotus purpuratus]
MEKHQLEERFKGILCSAGSNSKGKWSQVKHSSVDNSMPGWKDGKLHIAESHTSTFVLVVEYRNAAMKTFPLNVKSTTYIPSNKNRAVISLKEGTLVNIMQASASALEKMMDTINALGKKGKAGGNASQSCSVSQIDKTSPPWVKTLISPQKTKTSREQALTPSQIRSRDREEFTSVRTPTSIQKPFSPWKTSKRKTPDDEIPEEADGDDAENLGVSMLFSDQTDKENRYTPSRGDRQGVLQKRIKSGNSIFLDSFEEKQKGMGENKRKGPNTSMAVSHNFYSRGRQMSSYGASDLFSKTPCVSSSQSEESNKKSTPGFLVSRSTKVPRPVFSLKTWNKPSGLESSQKSLQGFSNLGNTCYMNAILQSLLGLQCFIQDLQYLPLIKALPKSSLYKVLAGLMYAKQNNKGSTDIEHRLQSVKAAISATATRFSGFMQHDAHEFLCQCLDQLKEDVEKVNNPKPDKEVPSKEVQEAVSPPSQVVPSNQSEDKAKFACAVSQNFELEVEHSILCQECGEEVSKKETFNDLSLDLPRTNEAFSLQTALDSFCASEKLDYACAKCDCKEATVCHKFTKLPRVLILHLKRYTYDSDTSVDGKLRLSVVIPRYLTLAFHTTENTAPPPPRSNHTPAIHVPLSPLRDNIGTPFNHSSPDEKGDGGSIRKKLDYDSNRSGFKFNRGRLSSDSAHKGSGHFISRFETEVAPDSKLQEKSKEERLVEMDEDQQFALAMELSRQDEEARLKRNSIKCATEEFTDEELAKALNDSMEAEERTGKPKDDGEESDEDLPVGLSEDVEMSDFEQALLESKRTRQEELRRQLTVNREGALRPLTNEGLLGGARTQLVETSTKCNSEKCNVMSSVGESYRRESEGEDERRRHDGEGGGGLLGGAKRYKQQPLMCARDEPMDTEDDQPIAFSLDNTDEEDPTQPRMWDTDPDQTTNKLKESHFLSSKESRPSDEDVEFVSDDALDQSDKLNARSVDHHGAKHIDLSSTPDHRTESLVNGTSHQSVSCSKVRVTTGPPLQSIAKSETKVNHDDESHEENGADLWKPYKKFKKNIFQQFSPTNETPVREDEERKDDDSAHRGREEEERRMSYDEMEAKEQEDIRKATELSMQGVKEISEREAAEILRAQEMSLQDLHQRQSITPARCRDRGEESKSVSPVYTKEEAEKLSKHSEAGHLNNAYRLVSIVSHIGSTSMNGHYISDVYDVEKKCWLSYDDSTVMKRDERRLREERRRTGYIFFYHAKEFL